MPHDEFFAVNTSEQPWEERYNEKLGRAIFRKDLYTDPETGAEIRLVRYPAGWSIPIIPTRAVTACMFSKASS